MLTAVLCGLKRPFEVRDAHQLLQSAHLHISLLRFPHPAADALDMPSVWRMHLKQALHVPGPAPGFSPTPFSFVFFSPSLPLIFAFQIVMQEGCKCPSRPICNPLVKLPLILSLLCILHRLFAFATCFTCTVLQALLHEGISLLIRMWCVSHS